MENNIVKFYGKFRELIPYGFKFQKLYARNYRQYCLSDPNNPHSCQYITIWQHHGGYVEFADIGQFSHLIINIFKPSNQQELQKFYVNKMGEYYHFVINKKTNSLEQYDRKKHDSMHLYFLHKDRKITDQELTTMYQDLFETYCQVRVNTNSFIIPAIHDMYAKNWLK